MGRAWGEIKNTSQVLAVKTKRERTRKTGGNSNIYFMKTGLEVWIGLIWPENGNDAGCGNEIFVSIKDAQCLD